MAGGQTEQKIDAGVARRTEGLPGIRGQVRHLVEAGGKMVMFEPRAQKIHEQLQVGGLAVSAPHQPIDMLLCWARRFGQQIFAHIA